jgi:GntR family transcriptional regulator / MocR family aminotransferase
MASDAGIDLPLLSRLYRGPEARNGFVMGFSALQPGEIRMGMERLAKAMG